jgi:hypothetical protein
MLGMDWQPIITAPDERRLELAVIDLDGWVSVLCFPCRHTSDGWLNMESQKWVDVRPTHWRDWHDPPYELV